VTQVELHGRYEIRFEASLHYPNPVQDVEVKVIFESAGQSRTVQAFWDGGNLWRVRFCPGTSGIWNWHSLSTNSKDSGLHGRSGEFDCTTHTVLRTTLHHGPLRVSSSRSHFIHADGIPFFWMADTAWNGPLLSSESDWAFYLTDRAQKGFSVIQFVSTQWIGAAGDATGSPAYLGQDSIRIVPEFFRRLDRRVDLINECGMVAAPVLAWDAAWNQDSVQLNPGNTLSEEQLIVLIRYMVSRYGAHNVIWILAGDGIYVREEAERWRRIGRAALSFTDLPATMHPAGKLWVAPEFRDESWFQLNGYQSGHWNDDDNFRWINEGPPSSDWRTQPRSPQLNLEPCYEDHIAFTSGCRISAFDVRRASYWSLLTAPPAGITYGAHGVWSWEESPALPLSHPHAGIAKPWHEAIDLPGSICMAHLKTIFTSLDWWRLQPSPAMLSYQPGKDAPAKFVSAACSIERDLAMIYSPEGGTIQLHHDFFPHDLTIQCFDPANGALLWQRLHLKDRDKDSDSIETGNSGDRLLVFRESNQRKTSLLQVSLELEKNGL